MDSRPRVALLHAFSRANAGDGLLVDLSLDALAEAGVAREQCTVFALDPGSFRDLENVERAPGEPAAVMSLRLAGAVGEALCSLAGRGHMADRLRQYDALVAVGGGYLVADRPTRQAGVFVNHLAQMRAAARHRGPTIYLPQSIGPLAGPAGALTRAALARVDRVWARDDETVAELALPNVRRCGDLAVMQLARDLAGLAPTCNGDPAILVARDLPAADGYTALLRELQALLPGSKWAVQADIEGPRSDRAFYRREGLIPCTGSLTSALHAPGGPIVSVRLHGAVAALLMGRPAIHLAYERKGWAAYADLGLDEYVHDARNFNPALVAAQALSLAVDPTPFVRRMAHAGPRLTRQWSEMVGELAARIVNRPYSRSAPDILQSTVPIDTAR